MGKHYDEAWIINGNIAKKSDKIRELFREVKEIYAVDKYDASAPMLRLYKSILDLEAPFEEVSKNTDERVLPLLFNAACVIDDLDYEKDHENYNKIESNIKTFVGCLERFSKCMDLIHSTYNNAVLPKEDFPMYETFKEYGEIVRKDIRDNKKLKVSLDKFYNDLNSSFGKISGEDLEYLKGWSERKKFIDILEKDNDTIYRFAEFRNNEIEQIGNFLTDMKEYIALGVGVKEASVLEDKNKKFKKEVNYVSKRLSENKELITHIKESYKIDDKLKAIIEKRKADNDIHLGKDDPGYSFEDANFITVAAKVEGRGYKYRDINTGKDVYRNRYEDLRKSLIEIYKLNQKEGYPNNHKWDDLFSDHFIFEDKLKKQGKQDVITGTNSENLLQARFNADDKAKSENNRELYNKYCQWVMNKTRWPLDDKTREAALVLYWNKRNDEKNREVAKWVEGAEPHLAAQKKEGMESFAKQVQEDSNLSLKVSDSKIKNDIYSDGFDKNKKPIGLFNKKDGTLTMFNHNYQNSI
ncbi:MAG: hypothetical protein K5769_04875 [Pseudobutyrivibrio sp.]|nr:hypothetical protein [Pseudobutyrivibrio sp.]